MSLRIYNLLVQTWDTRYFSFHFLEISTSALEMYFSLFYGAIVMWCSIQEYPVQCTVLGLERLFKILSTCFPTHISSLAVTRFVSFCKELTFYLNRGVLHIPYSARRTFDFSEFHCRVR